MEDIDLTTKMRALALLARYLHRPLALVSKGGILAWKGIANGDHIFIANGNLYRVDLCTEKVSKV